MTPNENALTIRRDGEGASNELAAHENGSNSRATKPSVTPTEGDIRRFAALFAGRTDVHGDSASGQYARTAPPYAAHLTTGPAIGIYMLTPGNTVRFAAVDVDRKEEPDQGRALAVQILECLHQTGLTAFLEKSRGKGWHVWLFFKEPMPAILVRRLLTRVTARCGHAKLEVFPKQDTLDGLKEGFGNYINLPYYKGKPGPEGRRAIWQGEAALTLEQFIGESGDARHTAEELTAALDFFGLSTDTEQQPPEAAPVAVEPVNVSDAERWSMVDLLAAAPRWAEQQGRHNAGLTLARELRNSGHSKDPEACEKAMRAYHATATAALPKPGEDIYPVEDALEALRYALAEPPKPPMWKPVAWQDAPTFTSEQDGDTEPPPADADTELWAEGIYVSRMDRVKPEPLEWVWKHFIAKGKLNLMEGDGGKGKSLLTLDIAARVTRGDVMPDGTPSDLAGPRDVIFMGLEDGKADTVLHRLEAAGADMSRVHVWDGLRVGKDGTRPASLAVEDLAALERLVRKTNAGMLIVDAFTAVLPEKVDSHKDQSIRSVLMPLAKLAERLGLTVLLIRHWTKGVAARASDRGVGSVGIGNTARSRLVVGDDPERPGFRAVGQTKLNLVPEGTATYGFQVVEAENGHPRIEWTGRATCSAEDIVMKGDQNDEERTERDDAEAFLLDYLAGGPKPSDEVEKAARKAGIAKATLRRAKKEVERKAATELGCAFKMSQKTGMDGGWQYHLPPKMLTDITKVLTSESEHLQEKVSTFESASSSNGIAPAVEMEDF